MLPAAAHLLEDRRPTLLQGEDAQHLQEYQLEHLLLEARMGQR